MRFALIVEGELRSPTVGHWRSVIQQGAPVVEGMLLGRLARPAEMLDVCAPAGSHGVISRLPDEGAWLEYGSRIGSLGDELDLTSGPAAPLDDACPVSFVVIPSPTDGTFFLCPEPGKAPFVTLGQRVQAKQTVGFVEVMKTFTSVRAPCSGVVKAIKIANEASVSMDQALFWIDPVGDE